MEKDLTRGPITTTMLRFALPMILGNMLQQLYNVADTLIVGQFLGSNALAAVGSAYTLMTFLTSVLIGLSMGSGVVFSRQYGEKNMQKLKSSIFSSFLLIAACTAVLNIAALVWIDPIMRLLQTPDEIYDMMRSYLMVIFIGLSATFLYNFFAALLRSVGNSVTPLIFLAISAILNIILDLVFVIVFRWGAPGAAGATVFSQFVSGIGLMLYTVIRFPQFLPDRNALRLKKRVFAEITQLSFLTCLQQSIMNFGILMVQGLVNSFGPAVMAAFAAAVKIDTFAYMPVQDFGNAFSTFVAQNYGAKKTERIQKGIRSAVFTSVIFCLCITAAVCIFARPLMLIFVKSYETEILAIGVQYLRIEGAFYCGIGCLFLLYGLYRALGKPGMSVILTIVSLGTRVILAYGLSAVPFLGVTGIWMSVPIGWFLADVIGFIYYRIRRKTLLAI
ncbi:MAG TPA: MATE family efflux transporter [Firmicutes bacterium]|nr:MATE family efflux transporter [Bacillota bacterium]